MKNTAITLMLSALSILSAACGGSEVESDGGYSFDITPEPEPEETPIPNVRPDAPAIAASTTKIISLHDVTFDLTLSDPDGDPLESSCTAAFTHLPNEVDATGLLRKVSETQYVFAAPITEETLATFVVRCVAIDPAGEVSERSQSDEVTIDNRVIKPGDDWDVFKKLDLCRAAPSSCKMLLEVGNLMDVRVPEPDEFIPDQLRGIRADLPHTDFEAYLDLVLSSLLAKKALLQGLAPSVQVAVGAGETGSGYVLELAPYATNTAKSVATLTIAWKWQVRSLAQDGLTSANMLGGVILAQGTMSAVAPSHVQATVRDGLLQFTINGAVTTPAIAATNVGGPGVLMGARAIDATFSNGTVTLKP